MFFAKLVKITQHPNILSKAQSYNILFSGKAISRFPPSNPGVKQEQKIPTEYKIHGMLKKGAIHHVQPTHW